MKVRHPSRERCHQIIPRGVANITVRQIQHRDDINSGFCHNILGSCTIGGMVDVAVISASSAMSDSDVMELVLALTSQLRDDFYPVWGRSACLQIYSKEAAEAGKVPLEAWWLALLDRSDVASALGYHDLTSTGQPLGKVFVRSALESQASPTVDASHELLEMLVDPCINLTVLADDGLGGAQLIAYEIGDPCQDDRWGYMKNGVRLSDFVYPEWFHADSNATQFDHTSSIPSPFTLSLGGYMSVLPLAGAAGWKEISNRGSYSHEKRGRLHVPRAQVGSRRERRALVPRAWIHSTVGVNEPSAPVMGKRCPVLRVHHP